MKRIEGHHAASQTRTNESSGPQAVSSKRVLAYVAFLIVIAIGAPGCPKFEMGTELPNSVSRAVAAIDRAETEIHDAPLEMKKILQGTIKEIEESGRSTLQTEIRDLLDHSIAATGSELRAETDFLADRVIQGLERIKAKALCQPLPVLSPHFCKAVPNAIKISLEQDRRDVLTFYGWDMLEGEGVKLWLISSDGSKTDVTSKVAIATHYEGTVNLGNNGVPFDRRSSKLQFECGVNRYEVNIIQSASMWNSRTETVSISDVGPFAPPKRGKGDAEFRGHGPKVTVRAQLRVWNNTLQTRLYMSAQEWLSGRPKKDFTQAEGWSEWKTVFTPERGQRISRILSPTESVWEYTDTNTTEDRGSDGQLVREFTCMGDTSKNQDAGVGTHVAAKFNHVKVEIVELAHSKSRDASAQLDASLRSKAPNGR